METIRLAMADHATPPTQILGFRELYEQHSEAVYYAALRVTGNPADAEDVLQTVFTRLLDHEHALDAASSPGAYLRRAAVNAAIDLLRRKKTRRESDIEGVHGPHSRLHVVSDDVREEMFFLKERLRAALARLAPENAELLVLHYLEGYSYDELAELLNVERGTIGSRLHRIKAALKEDLSD
jgi:RNA polymerase sigma-70 factor (ECF subfamily)